METLLVLTYATICWIVFKIFKIEVNKWSMTTVVLGGVIILGLTLMTMAYYHPASTNARTYFVSTPIVPNVRGIITKVEAKPNEMLEKGDILFEIDKTPFQAVVDDLQAQLEFAKKRLLENLSDLDYLADFEEKIRKFDVKQKELGL